MIDYAKEKWMPVPNYHGVLASNMGRVVKQPSCAPMPHGGLRWYKPKPTHGYITKACKKAAHEYRGVYFKGIGNIKVHRMVCMAFHGLPPQGKPVCIHLDEDAHNNCEDNLKWGTQKENLNMPKHIAYCKSRTGENSNVAKARRKREAA